MLSLRFYIRYFLPLNTRFWNITHILLDLLQEIQKMCWWFLSFLEADEPYEREILPFWFVGKIACLDFMPWDLPNRIPYAGQLIDELIFLDSNMCGFLSICTLARAQTSAQLAELIFHIIPP